MNKICPKLTIPLIRTKKQKFVQIRIFVFFRGKMHENEVVCKKNYSVEEKKTKLCLKIYNEPYKILQEMSEEQ